MDMGVGSFVMMNGMISAEARMGHESRDRLMGKSISSCVPILVLGGQRLLIVRSLNFQTIVTEYGTHCNFFFTLAAVKLICSIVHIWTRKSIGPLAAAAAILIAYQMMLSAGLGDLMLNEDRSNFILRNKEGIFSLPAYVSLYLVSVSLGSHMHHKRRTGKAVDHLLIAIECGICFAVSAILCILSHSFVQQVSRRQANLSFVLWIICSGNFFLMIEALLLLVMEFLMATGFLRLQSNSRSMLPQIICNNSLSVFLLANLMTGIVNLCLNAMQCSAITSLLVLLLYTSIVSLAAYALSVKQITFKLTHGHLLQMKQMIMRSWK